jgi:hypothetical protein
MPRLYRSDIVDHLGLVAGMDDALGMGEVLDRTMPHTPATRLVTVGHAVNALVRNGLGFVPQQCSLVPMCFQHTPTPRLVAPGIDAPHLHDETRGRAWETRYAAGVTARYRLIAVTAAHRLGLTPTCAPLDRTSCPVDGRDNRSEEPDAHVMPLTRGDRRAHRPDLHHVMLDVMVAHHAGSPVLMTPRSGHTHEARAVGPVVTDHMRPLQTTDGTTSLVADRALDRAANLQKLADTGVIGSTRVPATLTAAQQAWEQATLEARFPLHAGDRDHVWASTDGGVAHRGVRISSAHRRPQAQHTVDHHWRPQRAAEAKACQTLCRGGPASARGLEAWCAHHRPSR